ncbi:MAG TPA: hypothetical protein VL793_01205 [Patescibacteria group bacterium]|nr:hypothetical protein [Patescibacteria group bacterium]
MMPHRLRYGAGHFVAVGDDGKIASSSNGTNFVSDISGTTWNLRDVAFFKNTFLAVGDYGTILQSDPLSTTAPPEPAKLSATLAANGHVQLSLAGTPGATYLIEYTDVLAMTVKWSVLASFTATTNSSPVPVEAKPAQSQARFFRAHLQN